MKRIRRSTKAHVGYQFVNPSFLPDGADEYYARDAANPPEDHAWRSLSKEEISQLEAGGNSSDDWNKVLVEDPFLPDRVKNCEFYGLVRIGAMSHASLSVEGQVLPAGLVRSTIISSDLGSEVCLRDVRYLAHCIIGDRCVLCGIGEMYTTPTARFGMGVVRDGQSEDRRVWLWLVNENAGRGVAAFPSMRSSDAALWCRFRGDEDMLDRLRDITQHQFGSMRGAYSQVGQATTIRNCDSIVDLQMGAFGRIVSAVRLESLTVESCLEEPTEIADGAVLVEGIIHSGCRVTGHVQARRFVLGQRVTLSAGARLTDVFVGDNSTISCCEVLSSLICPAHEQHHNNSFLIAAYVGGQSNIAAGATIGSNHNSRAPDGEISARRGFWPGLCVSLKHSSRFASYSLIAKGSYPAELDVRLPFSLISQDLPADCLLVMPAYWWMYNMYALARNSWKFQARDQRYDPAQKIEFNALAPDTAEEILRGMELLALWTGRARLRDSEQGAGEAAEEKLIHLGRELLSGDDHASGDLLVLAEQMENSRRDCRILKPHAGYRAYRQMLLMYAVENLLDYMDQNPEADFQAMCEDLSGPRQREWMNLGGQIVWKGDLNQIIGEIRAGKLSSWQEIHAAWDRLWQKYPEDKQAHCLGVLKELWQDEQPGDALWQESLEEAARTRDLMARRTYESRTKDYAGHFRRMTFGDADEMRAVVGSVDADEFCRQMRTEADSFKRRIDQIRRRG